MVGVARVVVRRGYTSGELGVAMVVVVFVVVMMVLLVSSGGWEMDQIDCTRLQDSLRQDLGEEVCQRFSLVHGTHANVRLR
mmetsp:Transcript_23121/g.67378  ORF Transcript_23121/g.67378 Transcript_23121/m.67378 type:complete len:81 (-) Transcript_23121:734-976(-)